MKMHAIATAILLLAPTMATAQVLPVGKLSVRPSTSLGEIDADKMKGQPAKLAWSPDGTQLYLQLLDADFGKPGPLRHFVYTIADGTQTSVDEPPAWAVAYWTKKMDRYSPDDRAFMIDVESTQRTERTVSAPMGGDLARGAVGSGGDIGGAGGGTSTGEAIANAATMQAVRVNALKLGGETIGEFVNAVPVPGLTFGWGPAGSRAIVYARPKDGKLVIMDTSKKKQEIDGTKDALLPALSEDGRKLAWLRKDGRKKYSLVVADVTVR